MNMYQTIPLILLAISVGTSSPTPAKIPLVKFIEEKIAEQLRRAHENFRWLKLEIQEKDNQKTTMTLSGLHDLTKNDVIMKRDTRVHYPALSGTIHGWSGTIAFDNAEISFFIHCEGIQYKRCAKLKIDEGHFLRIPIDLYLKHYFFPHCIDIESLCVDELTSTRLTLSANDWVTDPSRYILA